MAGDVAQMGRRRGSAAESVRWPWTGWCGASPGSWAARSDDWWRCEANQGVSVARVRPAARNRERKKLTGGGGWFCFELRVAAAAARVLGRRGWMEGAQGSAGCLKGKGRGSRRGRRDGRAAGIAAGLCCAARYAEGEG